MSAWMWIGTTRPPGTRSHMQVVFRPRGDLRVCLMARQGDGVMAVRARNQPGP